MKLLKFEAAAVSAFIICLVFSCYKLDCECDKIRDGFLRLHVIAASDSEYDQKIKLELRDELLSQGGELFEESKTKKEAEEKIRKGLDELEEKANTFLKSCNYPYKASLSLEKSYFPTREYETFTLPAGRYNALKVTIGEGKGQNWWCVMFPALCLPAAEKNTDVLEEILTDRQQKIISGEKYEIRLWLVEKWQEVSDKFFYNN